MPGAFSFAAGGIAPLCTLFALVPAAIVCAVGGFALALSTIVTAASGCTAALVPGAIVVSAASVMAALVPAVAVAAGGLALQMT